MKHILFIDTGNEFGGGTKSLLPLLEHLSKQNLKVSVFFSTDYATPYKNQSILTYIKSLGINTLKPQTPPKLAKIKKEILRLFSKNAALKTQYKLDYNFALELLKQTKVDAIHLNNHFSTNLSYIHAANKLGIKVIQHLRKNAKIEPFKLEILKNLNFTPISVSLSTYEFYAKFLNLKKIIVYNPAITNNTEEPSNQAHEGIKILMAANYLELKGHEIVFDAFLKLKRKDISLILAGDGKLSDSARKKLEALKNMNIASELGFVSNMNGLYQQADYLLGFSSDEGLPRVVLEGLSMGLGVIFSDIAVAHEIKNISQNKDNFHIVSRNAHALSLVLESLKQTNKIADQNIINKFSKDSYLKGISKIYSDLDLL